MSQVATSVAKLRATIDGDLSGHAKELVELSQTGILPDGMVRASARQLAADSGLSYTECLTIAMQAVNGLCVARIATME